MPIRRVLLLSLSVCVYFLAAPALFAQYPAPPNTGLLANRPTFCALTGQQYYATDNTTLYYSTVAGTNCTWAAIGGGAGGVTTTGSPVAGQLTEFSGAATVTGNASVLMADQFAGANWGAKLAACIAALPAAGGTCDGSALTPGSTSTNPFSAYTSAVHVRLGAGKYTSTVNWALNTQSDSPGLKQGNVLIEGVATSTKCGYTCVQQGTILDFTAASGSAHIISLGFSHLEIEHVTISDDSGGSVPMLLATCTTVNIHDNTFAGSVLGNAANQDAIVLGTTGSASDCNAATTQYQGYGSRVDHNFFYQVRRWVVLGRSANDAIVTANYSPSVQSGGNLNGGAIEMLGGVGVTIADNIIEAGPQTYTYGINKTTGGGVVAFIRNNGLWDSTGVSVSNATCASTTETVTMSASNTFQVGQIISVTGISPSAWNATNVTLTAANPTGPSTVAFTVAGCPGSGYSSGGLVNSLAAGVYDQGGAVVDVGPGDAPVQVFTPNTNYVWDYFANHLQLASTLTQLSIGLNQNTNTLDVFGGVNVASQQNFFKTAPVGGMAIQGALVEGLNTPLTNAIFQVQNTFMNQAGGGKNPAAPLASTEFVNGVDLNGNKFSGQTTSDIAFQIGFDGGGFRHWLRTRHTGNASDANNAIDFYVNNSTTAGGSSAPGTGNNLAATLNYLGITAPGYQTATNCSSAAAPAVCGSAAAGSVVIAAAATTVTVNTTRVTANSQIFVFPDDTLGTKLSVTCNSTGATLISPLAVTARTAGTSFQITTGAAIAANPLCLSYLIVN